MNKDLYHMIKKMHKLLQVCEKYRYLQIITLKILHIKILLKIDNYTIFSAPCNIILLFKKLHFFFIFSYNTDQIKS